MKRTLALAALALSLSNGSLVLAAISQAASATPEAPAKARGEPVASVDGFTYVKTVGSIQEYTQNSFGFRNKQLGNFTLACCGIGLSNTFYISTVA